MQQITGERVLILRGVGGRETLAQTLRARGAEVDYGECYRRVRPQLSAAERAALWQPPADAVCVNSGETLANLWDYLPEPARQLYHRLPLLVPGERVAERIEESPTTEKALAHTAQADGNITCFID